MPIFQRDDSADTFTLAEATPRLEQLRARLGRSEFTRAELTAAGHDVPGLCEAGNIEPHEGNKGPEKPTIRLADFIKQSLAGLPAPEQTAKAIELLSAWPGAFQKARVRNLDLHGMAAPDAAAEQFAALIEEPGGDCVPILMAAPAFAPVKIFCRRMRAKIAALPETEKKPDFEATKRLCDEIAVLIEEEQFENQNSGEIAERVACLRAVAFPCPDLLSTLLDLRPRWAALAGKKERLYGDAQTDVAREKAFAPVRQARLRTLHLIDQMLFDLVTSGR